MFPKLLSSQIIIYNCILFFSFSLSVNYFANFEIVNYIAYALFHLTLVGDLVSVYIADNLNIDPYDITSIEKLKKLLKG